MSRRSTLLLVGVMLAADLCLVLALALSGDVDPSLPPEDPPAPRSGAIVPAVRVDLDRVAERDGRTETTWEPRW